VQGPGERLTGEAQYNGEWYLQLIPVSSDQHAAVNSSRGQAQTVTSSTQEGDVLCNYAQVQRGWG
jgi:hypothetical protein